MSHQGYSNLPQDVNETTKINLGENTTREEKPHDDFPSSTFHVQDKTPDLYTFDEALDTIGFGIYQLILMFICGSGWMFDGIELLLISFILPELINHWKLTAWQAGLCGSSVFFGMMIGASLGGMISDRYGRKVVFIGSIMITTVFGVASAASPSFVYFLIFRACAGIGLGASVPTDISLFMEFTPTKWRGLTMTLMNLYWVAGAVMVTVLAWIIMPERTQSGNHNWRYLVGISAAPGILITIARFFVPESPRYCMVHGRMPEAQKVVNDISWWNRKPAPPGRLIFRSHKAAISLLSSFMGLFDGRIVTTTLLLWVIWFCLSYGSWGFSFLMPLVYDRLNPGRDRSLVYRDTLLSILVGVLGYALLAIFVNRIGRKTLMGTTFVISGILIGCIAAWENPTYVLVMAIIVNFVSTAPWSVIYTYTPEVYPTTLRTTGVGACALFTRLAGTITPLIGQTLLGVGYAYPFISFGIAMVIAGLGSFLLPIETLNRELQDELTNESDLSANQIKPKTHLQKISENESMEPMLFGH